jgi:hypothetical protein
MQRKSFISISALCAVLVLSAPASAQRAKYIWITENGVKQYSDSPPPQSVPKDKILKSPYVASSANKRIEANSPETPGVQKETEKTELQKIEKPVTLASKNEDFNKRKIAKMESDAKAANEKETSANKAQNCSRASIYKKSLDNGVPIARTNEAGERQFLDEKARDKELAEMKKILSDCK